LPSLEIIYENRIEIVEKKFKENRRILKNSKERVRAAPLFSGNYKNTLGLK